MKSTSRSPCAIFFLLFFHACYLSTCRLIGVVSRSPRTRCKFEVPCCLSYDEWLTVFEGRHRSVGFARILSTRNFFGFGQNTVRGFRQEVRHIESIDISRTRNCTWVTCQVSLEYWSRQRLWILHVDNFFCFPDSHSHENTGVIIGDSMSLFTPVPLILDGSRVLIRGHNSTRRSIERKERTELQREREKLARNVRLPSSFGPPLLGPPTLRTFFRESHTSRDPHFWPSPFGPPHILAFHHPAGPHLSGPRPSFSFPYHTLYRLSF